MGGTTRMDQVKRWLTMSGADPPPADSDNLGGVADVATTTPAVGPDASSSLPRTEGAVDEETPQRRQSGLHKFIARRRESLHNILDGRKSAGSSSDGASPVSSPLFGRRHAPPAAADAAKVEEKDTFPVIKTGVLQFVEKRKLKSGAFVLTTASLSSVDSGSRQWLRDVSAVILDRNMEGDAAAGMAYSFSIFDRTLDKQVVLGCEKDTQHREWVLMMNAACMNFNDSMGALSHTQRIKLMNAQFLERFSGGVIKREEVSEEWQYRKSGALIMQGDSAVSCASYQWDGATLEHVKGPNYGRGVWDGLVLAWYPVAGVAVGFEKNKVKKKKSRKGAKGRSSSMIGSASGDSSGGVAAAVASTSAPTGDTVDATLPAYDPVPSMRFMWSAVDNSYAWLEGARPVADDVRNWKWSRHFLTKMQGIGHWIAEGSVPEPVCMLVQMMRYQRMGYNLKNALAPSSQSNLSGSASPSPTRRESSAARIPVAVATTETSGDEHEL